LLVVGQRGVATGKSHRPKILCAHQQTGKNMQKGRWAEKKEEKRREEEGGDRRRGEGGVP